MSAPLAYFLSWTTYGTWLHGDTRRWVRDGIDGIQEPDPALRAEMEDSLAEEPFIMDTNLRKIVDQAIRDHCAFRRWTLHALNVRTNHVHVVLTADCTPEKALQELKSWATRRLKPHVKRKRYWTKHGSTKWVNDEEYLYNSVNYVLNLQ